MKAKALVELTGEQLEYQIDTPEQMVEVWRLASEYIKAWEKIKDAIKKLDIDGVEANGYSFVVTPVQRMTYDKTVLREVIKDQDLLDTFLIPDKTAIDKYLREYLDEVGIGSTILRESMVPVGKPYTVPKLVKVER